MLIFKDGNTLPCLLTPGCILCGFSTCQNAGKCIPTFFGYTCECQTGYEGEHCEAKSPTTVVSTGPQTSPTPQATTAFTPPATSAHKTTTTMKSKSSERISTASSMEPATAQTKYSFAPTGIVAEVTFNSSSNGSTRLIIPAIMSSSTTEEDPSTRSEEASSSPFLEEDKNTTIELPCWLHSLCFVCVFTCDGTCIPDHENYTCECQTGKTCDQESSTTVVSSTSQTDSTHEESTTTFTPSATSTNETTTTMMSTSSEGISTALSMEPATAPTQHSSASTTNVAEISFNSSTNGSTRAFTSPTIALSATEAEPSTRSEEATLSPIVEEEKKSVPVSLIAGSIGGIVLIVLLTIGLVILFRKRKRRYLREHNEMCKNNIHCNPAYDDHCAPSADNVSASSKDSGFGKHDESVEGEMMDGEYNTLRLHFPVTTEPPDNAYNHIDGPLTAKSTYSHIPNSKDVLFDNTYSHMANVTYGKSLEPDDKDATYNHLGDSCSSKRKGKAEESRDETYDHAQMSHVRPTADQEDQEDDYSHINLSGLKAQVPNAEKHHVDGQEPTRTNVEYAQAKTATKKLTKGGNSIVTLIKVLRRLQRERTIMKVTLILF